MDERRSDTKMTYAGVVSGVQQAILGIDFGTTKSVVATANTKGIQAILRPTTSCDIKTILGLPNSGNIDSTKVAGDILRGLKTSAETNFTLSTSKAFIGVPSYFNALQREAVENAGKHASLDVQTIHELSAAAARYAHKRHRSNETIALVDVGGGGGSVSIVNITKDHVTVLASSEVQLPGGNAFDKLMMQNLNNMILSKYNVNINNNAQHAQVLKQAWAETKKELSTEAQASLGVQVSGKRIELTVTRRSFEELCFPLFQQIVEQVIITKTKAKVDHLQTCFLVGASTKIPFLEELIGNALPGVPLSKELQSDECVAEGCAILANGLVKVRYLKKNEQSETGASTASSASKPGRKQKTTGLTLSLVESYVAEHFQDLAALELHIQMENSMNKVCSDIAQNIMGKDFKAKDVSFVRTWVFNARKNSSGAVPKPLGIHNEGKTCYLNSAVQTLFAVQSIREAVINWDRNSLRHADNNIEQLSQKIDLVAKLQTVFKELQGPTQKTAISLKFLKNQFEQACHMVFNDWNDAIECWNVMRNILQDVLALSQTSVVNDTFESTFVDIVTCLACNKTTTTETSRYCVELPVPQECSVQNLIDNLSNFEQLNEWKCDDCEETKGCWREENYLKNAPQILCIALNRFQYSEAAKRVCKIDTRVSIDEEINISKLVHKDYFVIESSHEGMDRKNKEYELLSIIAHSGSALSGHYTTYVKASSTWFSINDSQVLEVSFGDVKTICSAGRAFFLQYKEKAHVSSLNDVFPLNSTAINDQPPNINVSGLSSIHIKEIPSNKKGNYTADSQEDIIKHPPARHSPNPTAHNMPAVSSIHNEELSQHEDDEDTPASKPAQNRHSSPRKTLDSAAVNVETTSGAEHKLNWELEEDMELENDLDDDKYEEEENGHEQNNSKQKRRQKREKLASIDYKNYEGSFEVPRESWNKVFDWDTCRIVNRVLWTAEFKAYIIKFREHCKMQWDGGSGSVYRSRLTGKLSVRAYAKCGRGQCKFYSLVFCPEKDQDLLVDVYSGGVENHEDPLTKTTQVRGGQRDMFKAPLEHTTAHMLKNRMIRELNPLVRASNNFQNVKSDAVYRQMRSEKLSEDDIAKDDFFDIVMLRRNELEQDSENRYIQMVSEPLMVHLFAESILKVIFEYFRYKSKITCHLDATGKFIRSTVFYPTDIYLYSCVVLINATYLPLFSLISCLHDQDSIGSALGKFRRFCESVMARKWPCVGRIVVDCSFALIHAIMRYWNSTCLQSYLNNCYNHCKSNPTTINWNLVVLVRLCKNHWTKMSCGNLKAYSIEGKLKAFIVESVLKLMAAKSLSEFDIIFENFALILLSKVKHEGVVEAFDVLAKHVRDDFREPTGERMTEELDENTFVQTETLETTAFHVHCRKISNAVEESVKHLPDPVSNKSEDNNPFYCKVFLEKIFYENHYAALIPLWTCLMDTLKTSKSGFVATNAPVEGYFQIKKKHVHQQLHNKPGRFVREDREYNMGSASQIKMRIRTDGRRFEDQQEVEENEMDVDDPDPISGSYDEVPRTPGLDVTQAAEESWAIPKPKFSYSQGKTTTKIDNVFKGKGKKVFDSKPSIKTPAKQQTVTKGKSGKKDEKGFSKNTGKSGQKIGLTTEQLLGKNESWKRSFKDKAPPSSCVAAQTKGHISFSEESKAMAESLKLKNDLKDALNQENREETRLSANSEREEEIMPFIDDHSNNKPQDDQSKLSTKPKKKRKLSLEQPFVERKKRRLDTEDKEDLECMGNVESSKEEYQELMLKTHYKFYSDLNPPKPKWWDKLDQAAKDMLHAVTKGDDKRPIMVYGENDCPAYISCVEQLVGEKRLDSSTVDACLWLLSSEFRNDKFYVATVSDSLQVLLTAYEETFALNMVDFQNLSWLILPCNTSIHWFLFVVHIEERRIYILDSADQIHDPNETKLMVGKFNKFWQENITHKRKKGKFCTAQSVPWKFSKQNDDVNCGVYLLRYVEGLLKDENTIVHFCPEEYRIVLAQKLVADIKCQHDNSANKHRDALLFERYENGLLQSPQYYCSPYAFEIPETHDRIVADYGLGFHPVEASSFRKLCNGEWLTNFVIDAALNCALTEEMRSTYLNVRSKEAFSIITHDAWHKNFVTFLPIYNKTLIMPVLLGEAHWCLIWVEIQNKQYRFFDPQQVLGQNMYFNDLLKYLAFHNQTAKNKIDLSGWTIMQTDSEFQKQKDNNNCGVFVLYFIFRLLKLERSVSIDPCAYRHIIACHLLENAPNMRHLCGICARDEFWRTDELHKQDLQDLQTKKTPTAVMRMIQCGKCRRWFHHCCDKDIKDVSFSAISAEEYEYVCEVCRAYTQTTG